MIKINNYVKVKSLEEAYELNQKKENRIVGGMMWMRMSKGRMQTAIDLSELGLNEIEETEEEFRVGCMCSLRQLELHEGMNTYFNGAVRESVRHIVGTQFRNQATVGGSIFGRFGFSDVLTCFLALDTYVELFKGGIVPLCEFVNMERDRDILVRLIIKKDGREAAYLSERMSSTDFPILACAAAIKEGRAYISLGARPMKAELFVPDEIVTEENVEDVARKAAEAIRFSSNMRGSEQYREHLAKVLVKRDLKKENRVFCRLWVRVEKPHSFIA